MAIIKGTSVTTSELLSTVTQPGQRLISVRVIDIILSESHDKFEEFGNYDSIGTIFYTKIEDDIPLESEKYASSAKPLFSFIKSYPLINEIVLIVSANDKTLYNTPNSITNYYLPNINIWNSPHHNALPTIKNLKGPTSIRDYENTQNGIIRQPTDEATDINLGDYFNEQLNIKSLLPYEGDNIIEGRFGNSIRFGSTTLNNNPWSLTGSIGDPITIIRNGQDKNLTTGWIPTIEDINNDNSSLYMTSTQQLSNFIPASTHQKSFGANYIAPVPLEVQFTQVPANTVIIEPIPAPISNEEFLIDESEPYVPSIESPPTSSSPISNDPFGDFENEVLEAGGGVGIYEFEPGTDTGTIDPQSTELILNYIEIDTDDSYLDDEEEEVIIEDTSETPIVLNEMDTDDSYLDEEEEEIIIETSPIPTGVDETEEEVLTAMGEYGLYNLNDLCFSPTAISHGIDNRPGRDVQELNLDYTTVTNNLKRLAVNILTPLRQKYGTAMKLTSGYRCSELDKQIYINNGNPGGGGKGPHTRGTAADIQIENVPTSEIFNYIKNLSGFEFNQLIWEYPERGTYFDGKETRSSWIHIATEYSERKRLTLISKKSNVENYYLDNGAVKSDAGYVSWYSKDSDGLQPDWTDANQDLIDNPDLIT